MTLLFPRRLFPRAAAAFAVGLPFLAACSHIPPKELIDAREAFTRVSASDAAQLDAADVEAAKRALDEAERAFYKSSDADRTKDLAYVAQRKAEQAEAQTGAIKAAKEKTDAEQRLADAMAKRSKMSAAQLSEAQRQLEEQKAQLAAEKQALEAAKADQQKSQEQLDAERQARLAAEAKAKEATDGLEKIAQVRQEARGTVITLPGGVLFPTSKFALRPAAKAKLDKVAEALLKTDAPILVEGHTDSRGSDATNEALSMKRADAVRSYLVEQGLPEGRVTAKGLGATRPVSDNTTAEGRTENRRVEIVIVNRDAKQGSRPEQPNPDQK